MNGVPWRDPTYDLVIWLATVVTFVGVFAIVFQINEWLMNRNEPLEDWHWGGNDYPETDISGPFEVVFVADDQADKTARPSEVKANVRG